MKTKTYIALAVLLTVSFNLSAVENYKDKGTGVSGVNPVDLLYRLAPVTPIEASFDEEIAIYNPISLIPYTPEFAEFEDVIPEPAVNTESNVAPVVPAEATFEEEVTNDGYSSEFLESIKPSVPHEAAFEDLN